MPHPTSQTKASELIEAVCRGGAAVELTEVLAVHHDSGSFSLAASDEKRRELLAAVRAGEVVELEADVLAYRQKPGEHNHNHVRFKPSILAKLAQSFKGRPLLRDHEETLAARAGTVLASKREKLADNEHGFSMRVRLTAPWAVEALLSGNLDRFSIGWFHGGASTIHCSWDSASIRECWHYPGQRVAVKDKDGNVVDEHCVEWVFTEASGRELSAVSVPAVEGTGIKEIRAAASALRAELSVRDNRGTSPQKGRPMDELKKALGLSESASDAEVLAKVEALKANAETLKSSNDALKASLSELTAREQGRAVEALFARAHSERRFPVFRGEDGQPAQSPLEASLRKLAAEDIARATEVVNALEVQPDPAATPLRSVPQSFNTPAAPVNADGSRPTGTVMPSEKQLAGLGLTAEDVVTYGSN